MNLELVSLTAACSKLRYKYHLQIPCSRSEHCEKLCPPICAEECRQKDGSCFDITLKRSCIANCKTCDLIYTLICKSCWNGRFGAMCLEECQENCIKCNFISCQCNFDCTKQFYGSACNMPSTL